MAEVHLALSVLFTPRARAQEVKVWDIRAQRCLQTATAVDGVFDMTTVTYDAHGARIVFGARRLTEWKVSRQAWRRWKRRGGGGVGG